MELEKLSDWMKFFSNQEKLYKNDNITIHIYGEGDDSYFVIEEEISKSPKTIKQYTVHALNKANCLFAFICFLNECDFSLKLLMSKISSATYVEDGMNDICQFEHVEIARYQLQEN